MPPLPAPANRPRTGKPARGSGPSSSLSTVSTSTPTPPDKNVKRRGGAGTTPFPSAPPERARSAQPKSRSRAVPPIPKSKAEANNEATVGEVKGEVKGEAAGEAKAGAKAGAKAEAQRAVTKTSPDTIPPKAATPARPTADKPPAPPKATSSEYAQAPVGRAAVQTHLHSLLDAHARQVPPAHPPLSPTPPDDPVAPHPMPSVASQPLDAISGPPQTELRRGVVSQPAQPADEAAAAPLVAQGRHALFLQRGAVRPDVEEHSADGEHSAHPTAPEGTASEPPPVHAHPLPASPHPAPTPPRETT